MSLCIVKNLRNRAFRTCKTAPENTHSTPDALRVQQLLCFYPSKVPSVVDSTSPAQVCVDCHKVVFVIDTSAVRHPFKVRSGDHLCSRLYAQFKRRPTAVYMLVCPSAGSTPFRMSVLGDGWLMVPPCTEVVVEWQKRTQEESDNLHWLRIVWLLAGCRKTPLREVPAAVSDFLREYDVHATAPSYRQCRTSFLMSTVHRDMYFISQLRGRDCCLLADSTPWGDNTELTAFLVSWLDVDGTIRIHPIHVTVESGKSSQILFDALLRISAYYDKVNQHLISAGWLCVLAIN